MNPSLRAAALIKITPKQKLILNKKLNTLKQRKQYWTRN